VARPVDLGRSKQFRRGMAQLDEEGVVQVLVSDLRGDQAPVLAAVGPMQFDVVSARMAGEFSSPVKLETLPYRLARATDAAGAEALNRSRIVQGEALTRIRDKAQLALFPDRRQAGSFEREFPAARLDHLIAAHEQDGRRRAGSGLISLPRGECVSGPVGRRSLDQHFCGPSARGAVGRVDACKAIAIFWQRPGK
jgi:hypothetical protein